MKNMGCRGMLRGRRGAVTDNAQGVSSRCFHLRDRGEIGKRLEPGGVVKGQQRRFYYGSCMERVGSVCGRHIASYEMFRFGGRGAGLQVVRERNHGKQDHDQYG